MRWTKKQYHAHKAGKSVPTSANDLTSAIITYLSLHGWMVWRQNNVAVYDKQIGQYRAFTGMRGLPDIIGFNKKTGVFIAVEVKAGDDQLSPDQINFLHALNKSGGLGIVARSLDDVIKIIEK